MKLHQQFKAWTSVCVTLLASWNTMPASAQAATYYVSTSGNNANAGTLSSPWCTVNYGAGRLAAGDTLYVRGGTYVETVGVWNSGTASAPITIAAYPGESPIIDANTISVRNWSSIVTLGGQYTDISGFEVRNINLNGTAAGGYGVYAPGAHNTMSKMNVHDTWENGIIATGDYSIIEDCDVWHAGMHKSHYLSDNSVNWPSGLSTARDTVNGLTDYSIIRRNTVHDNYGEGLSSYEANGTIIEDNVVYDNLAVNLYLSDLSNALVQRNIVYTTRNSNTLYGRPARGLALANEVKNPLNNVTIINNMVLGTTAPFSYFGNTGTNSLSNTLIANNTFANGVSNNNLGPGDGTTVTFGCGTYTNVQFRNNLVLQENSFPVSYVANGNIPGLTLLNNLWSKTPSAGASGSGDVIANPQLAKSGPTAARQLTSDYFKLLSTSPAINAGMVLSQVAEDYFKSPRGTSPDIGAHEYAGSTAPDTTPPTAGATGH